MFSIILTSGPFSLHTRTMLEQVEAKEEEEGNTLDSNLPEKAWMHVFLLVIFRFAILWK